jgi:hypothetical protein
MRSSGYDKPGALLSRCDRGYRTRVEIKIVSLDAIAENRATGRHQRLEVQMLAGSQHSGNNADLRVPT